MDPQQKAENIAAGIWGVSMSHSIQTPWQRVSIERNGVTFHGHYSVGPHMIIVLYRGHARSMLHEQSPLEELACQILGCLVAEEQRPH